MEDVTIARALHVTFLVLWIGGVAFVTTVLLPAVRRLKPPQDRMELFDNLERLFARQARISTAIVGLTGVYMLYRFNMWHPRSVSEPETALKRLEWLHRVLLFVSLATVLGAVMGSHGLLLFEGTTHTQ